MLRFDSWGKLLSTSGSLAETFGAEQPFRYRGYVYDEETGWYYLQSRYYNPEVGRFISADVYLSTDQGVLGHNSYAYCLNNPVNCQDGAGCRASHLTDVMTDGELSVTQKYRDVTHEIDAALMEELKKIKRTEGWLKLTNVFGQSIYISGLYLDFAIKVNHKAKWDIKIDDSWENTIGSTFPGEAVAVMYRGILMTPEDIGNFTYGYIGAAYGISLDVLYMGSYYAADFPTEGDDFLNEMNDRLYIEMGFYAHAFD